MIVLRLTRSNASMLLLLHRCSSRSTLTNAVPSAANASSIWTLAHCRPRISPRRILHPRARYKQIRRGCVSQAARAAIASSSDHTALLVGLAVGKVAPMVGFTAVYSHTTALLNALLSSLWMRPTV